MRCRLFARARFDRAWSATMNEKMKSAELAEWVNKTKRNLEEHYGGTGRSGSGTKWSINADFVERGDFDKRLIRILMETDENEARAFDSRKYLPAEADDAEYVFDAGAAPASAGVGLRAGGAGRAVDKAFTASLAARIREWARGARDDGSHTVVH
jgi:hypothetical protein